MMNAEPSLDTHRCPRIDVDIRTSATTPSVDARVSIARCCGAAVAALGLVVLLGWWSHIPALTTVLPGLVSMKANTAAGFLLMGAALALAHRSAPRAVVLMRVCASLALVMAVLTLVEFLAGVELGIDNLLITGRVYDSPPVSMALATAIAFTAASVALLLLSWRSYRSRLLHVIQATTGFIVTGVGALGLTGYAVNVDALYSWPPFGTMALHTTAGFCVLGMGLSLMRAASLPPAGEEERIAGRATTLIALVSVLVGIAALAATESGLTATMAQGLQATLQEYSALIRTSISLRTNRVAAIANRADLQQRLRLLAANPSRSDLRAALRNELELSAANDAAITLLDRNGDALAHVGRPLDRVPSDQYAAIATGIWLAWHEDGLHVRHEFPLQDSRGWVGTLISDQYMAEATRPPKLEEWLGKSWQLLLCSQRSHGLECFRTRAPFEPLLVYAADPLASFAQRALRGERDVASTLDEQHHRMVVGYAPLEPFGLVALLSVQSIEIYRPIGRQFRWVILLIAASSLAGYLLVRTWVRPLAASLEERVRVRTAELAGANTRLAESEQRFRTTFESAPVAMMLADPDGRIVLMNAQTEKLFGYRTDELLGQSIEMLVPPSQREAHVLVRQRFGENALIRQMGVGRELRAVHKDGHELVVEVGLSPVRSEAGTSVLATIVDLSEYLRQAEVLRQINAALARSNQELERFAYVASHDLQTPLRSIASFAELLGSTYGAKLDAQGVDWLHRITESTRQLQMLIRDLLEYSRIEAETHLPERVPMAEVFTQVLELLDDPIRATSAQVTSGELPVVMGHRSQLLKLLLNLIENGLKYHGSEPPRVHVSAVREERVWHFRVTDNGIGIAVRHHERIFEIFERLHSQRTFPGTGIGLAACRRVVELHGGRIWVESEPGRGSVFHFTILESSNG